MDLIKLNHVSCFAPNRRALLNDIDITLQEGDHLAVLGSNGAGKTSLLEVILGIIKPGKGFMSYNGLSLSEFMKESSVIWDQVDVFPWLKVKEVLRYFALLKNAKNGVVSEVSHLLGLDVMMESFVKTLSKGEKKKLSIAIALLNDPKVLIMDEMSSDLDRQTINVIWESRLKFSKTVLFTTHHWDEAQDYATKVMFMQDGSIVLPPVHVNRLFEDFPFKHKVVIDVDVSHLSLPLGCQFRLEGHHVILLKSHQDPILDEIIKHTQRFSVLDVELTDIYNFLVQNNESNIIRDLLPNSKSYKG